jgi:glutathione S-transferase
MMLKILGKSTSINVRKVLWACEEIGVAFDREDWGSGFRDTNAPEFLALNPNALVPVVVDGDFVLWESNTIIRYLAAEHGATTLLPNTPRARAQIERWMDWQATELNGSWRYAFQALVRKHPGFSDADEIASSLQSWSRSMDILNQQLAVTQAYVAGPEFTLADIPIGLSVNRWFMTPSNRPAFAAVQSYYDKLSERAPFLRHGRNGTP